MVAIPFAYAKSHLGDLMDLAQTGGAIEIAHGEKPVARLPEIVEPSKRIDSAALRSLTSSLPNQTIGAVDLIRAMRDGDRF